MTAPDFWLFPRLQWPGSAAEMRDALLYWIGAAPTTEGLSRLLNGNAGLIARLEVCDSDALGEAIRSRRAELRGE